MTFEQTHPWISFTVDLRRAQPALWMLLGEARSKCDHIAGVPLEPTTARRLHQLYLAKGALATTAIEGNTLSEREVVQHLEGKLRLPPSKQYLAKEIDNIVAVCNQVLSDAVVAGGPSRLSLDRIKEFNRRILDALELEEGVVPGEVRKHSVGVARYRGAPSEDCEDLLKRLCDWLNGPDFAPASDLEIEYAILRAIIAHLYLAWIHPFGDGNGRTARMVEFQILVTAGVPSPAAHLLSNHYNQTRAEYYRQLDRASRSGGDILPFIDYALRGFVDGLRSQLAEIREQQLDVTWVNYVHEAFKDRTRPPDVRRRRLVLDLTKAEGAVPFARLRAVSPRVAEAYARKTPKTLSRDINTLLKMGLVKQTPEGFVANREIILAFLPKRAGDPKGTPKG